MDITSERWLPAGVWEKCFEEKKFQKDQKIILAFDGSYSRDNSSWSEFHEEKPHIRSLGTLGKTSHRKQSLESSKR